MDTIRENDIPTCSLIGITEVVAAERPAPAEVVRIWQAPRMAPFTGANVPAEITRDRPLLILIDDEPITEQVVIRIKTAIERRLKEQMIEQPASPA